MSDDSRNPLLAPCGCDGRARLRGGRLRARLLSGASFDGHRRGGRGERDRRGRSAGRRTAYASVGLQDLRHGDAARRRYGSRVRRRTQGVLFGRFAQARRGGGDARRRPAPPRFHDQRAGVVAQRRHLRRAGRFVRGVARSARADHPHAVRRRRHLFGRSAAHDAGRALRRAARFRHPARNLRRDPAQPRAHPHRLARAHHRRVEQDRRVGGALSRLRPARTVGAAGADLPRNAGPQRGRAGRQTCPQG